MTTTFNTPAQDVVAHLLHATGLKSTTLDPLGIINDAGEYFVSVRAWRFLRGAEAMLHARGNIDFTDGNWSDLAKRLTMNATTPFTGYTHVDGDRCTITSGTGATLLKRTVEVTSTNQSDQIFLGESISSDASDITNNDIAGTLHLSLMELPDDCAHIKAIAASSAVANGIELVDHQDLLLLRGQYDREDDTGVYRGALIYDGDPPRPLLDVFPDFSSDQQDVFRISYLRGWTRITQGSQNLTLPAYCIPAFKQLCRVFVLGWEDEDVATLDERLVAWEHGGLLSAAFDQDSRSQRSWGRMSGGAIRRSPHRVYPNSLSSEIAGPS